MRGIEVYNKHGHTWLESKASDLHTQDLLVIISELVSAKDKNTRILDLCCGYGRLTLPLLEKGWNVSGVDLSPVLIQEAEKRRVEKKIGDLSTFKIGDMKSIPYPDGEFDFCFCVWASLNFLTSLEDQLKTFNELFRLLKPNGTVFIELPFHNDENPVPQEIEADGNSYLYFPFTITYLSNLLKGLPFKDFTVVEREIAGRRRITVNLQK
ncbi:class I SAM-dependent methyltransferase [Leptospira idonii]|nr:class I SAM-dependent methyltransferase [Leptospira idonii]